MGNVLKFEISPSFLLEDLPFVRIDPSRKDAEHVVVGHWYDGTPIWADADVIKSRERTLREATRRPDERA